MKIEAVARRYKPTQVWTEHKRIYEVRFKNRKRAINWALDKIEREFPDYPEHEATIIEEINPHDPDGGFTPAAAMDYGIELAKKVQKESGK